MEHSNDIGGIRCCLLPPSDPQQRRTGVDNTSHVAVEVGETHPARSSRVVQLNRMNLCQPQWRSEGNCSARLTNPTKMVDRVPRLEPAPWNICYITRCRRTTCYGLNLDMRGQIRDFHPDHYDFPSSCAPSLGIPRIPTKLFTRVSCLG